MQMPPGISRFAGRLIVGDCRTAACRQSGIITRYSGKYIFFWLAGAIENFPPASQLLVPTLGRY